MKQCARCQYDLRSLPEEHVCPECGLQYDEHVQVYVLRPLWREYRTIGYAFLLLALMWLARPAVGVMPAVVAAGIVVLDLILVVGRIAARRGTQRAIILCREGLRLEDSVQPAQLIPWREVGWVRYRWARGDLRIDNPGGERLVCVSWLEFGSRRQARRCAAEINRLRSVYNRPDGADPALPP